MAHFDPGQFSTRSLNASPKKESIQRILSAALNAVDPANAVHQHLRRDNDHLVLENRRYNLTNFQRILVVGFGKASLPMAEAASAILGNSITQGLLITKTIPQSQLPIQNSLFTILQASHPIPDHTSLNSGQSVVELLSTTTENDLVIFLISGGGSALLTLPAAGISLDDLQSLTQTLLACGATIHEINCLRKHLSQIKGGQLARLAAPAQMLTLILSDVVGDPLDVIASGPTVPDPTTFPGALAILSKYRLADQVPPTILNYLQRGASNKIPETPKTGDPVFDQVQNVIVGSNLQAAQAAIQQAKTEGFNPILLTTSLTGEAKTAGQMLGGIANRVANRSNPIPRPACIIAGGETTVTLTSTTPSSLTATPLSLSVGGEGEGDRGGEGEVSKGGRNQELALGAVNGLAGLRDIMLIALATDGEDGPTDAAGAVVTGETLHRAQSRQLDPNEYLARNDSYNFFDPLGDLLKPGSTQTNVNDLTFVFAF